MVTYREMGKDVKLITVHSLKDDHKENRIRAGRWRKIWSSELKVNYDEEEDILYIAEEGFEEEVVEIYPGVNVELDADGRMIGIEIMRASEILRNVILLIEKKAMAA